MICICSSHPSWHHVCDIPAWMNDRRVEEMEKRTANLTRKETTMKVIPAIFFQKQLNGVKDKEAPAKPERLELFESELREVGGGLLRRQGTDTYSYSAGWLDVSQADDCSA